MDILFIQRAVSSAHGRLSRAPIVILSNSHCFLLSRSFRFRCGGFRIAAIFPRPALFTAELTNIYSSIQQPRTTSPYIEAFSCLEIAFSFNFFLHTHFDLSYRTLTSFKDIIHTTCRSRQRKSCPSPVQPRLRAARFRNHGWHTEAKVCARRRLGF